MIFKRRHRPGVPSGFLRFESSKDRRQVFGPSDGDYIHLRDEFGNEWRGVAERQADDTIRYRFRDSQGNYISGISDGYGVTLRDQKGRTWRGFFD
jgi:hypothetical protein